MEIDIDVEDLSDPKMNSDEFYKYWFFVILEP